MAEMEAKGPKFLSVPRKDGEFLNLLVKATRAKKVLEIGTSHGYSAIWISLGLEETGGHMTIVEIQSDRVALAKEHLARAEALKVIEQNSRTGVELLKKAVAASQATTIQDAQAKSVAFYEGCLNAMRDTALAVTQATSKATESWLGYVRRSTEPVAARKS